MKTPADLLAHLRLVDQEIGELKSVNAHVFEKLEELEALRESIKDEAKRSVLSRGFSPPAPTRKVWVQAEEGEYKFIVQYKRKAHWFDPTKLEPELLVQPQVVEKVSAEALRSCGVGKDHPAFRYGDWMAPVVIMGGRNPFQEYEDKQKAENSGE